ncbi:hypothetical protein B5M09_007803 [Aphanomyces astaci]|uniref:Uncharacterized protein n=1 Tax=Aphanomyces astaci TaxID=112090 RepID=A0A3R7W9N2_APHAT|nr:hypothetical protein B5M09_007803 [Aphanomyces astaci]
MLFYVFFHENKNSEENVEKYSSFRSTSFPIHRAQKMNVRTCRRVVQVLTLLSMLAGCAIAYFGIIVSSSLTSTADSSSSSVTAVMLATFGVVYVAVSMVGFCGVLATKERLQFLMIYFYSTLFISVAFIVFAYMALVAPSTMATWLKLHWSALPLRHHACCRTFDDAHAYELPSSQCVLSHPSLHSEYRFISTRYAMLGALGITLFVLAGFGLAGSRMKSRPLLLLVTTYIAASLHLLGIVAIMLSCCVAVALAGAVVLRRSFATYQTESI